LSWRAIASADVPFAQMPGDLMSRNTLKNIEKNKERTDYCVTTFSYISNRCPWHTAGGTGRHGSCGAAGAGA
jgi:hypothetical protein